MSFDALVVSAHGRHCVVETPEASRCIAHPRGKKSAAVVGDRVQCSAPPKGQGDEGVIERVLPRRNVFYRQDALRTKTFAANLDQVLIWLAAQPAFSAQQLGRALIAAQAAGIAALIVLNKSDLTDAHAQAWQRLETFAHMGYALHAVTLRAHAPQHASELAALRRALHGKATLVLGPSGSGKSTLINTLLPQACVPTADLSPARASGRHTTTATQWHWIERASATALIDSPGFQEFGLHHIAPAQLPALMPDIAAHTAHCRFYNCTHIHEPGCAVLAACAQGHITAQRHAFYAQLRQELEP